MQDLEPFETAPKVVPRHIELMFIDAGGMRTREKNADIAVSRGRYDSLPLGLGAMALYALQSWAPAGGPGQLTSLRGGGPLVTLAQPEELDRHGLWRTVWLNTPLRCSGCFARHGAGVALDAGDAIGEYRGSGEV